MPPARRLYLMQLHETIAGRLKPKPDELGKCTVIHTAAASIIGSMVTCRAPAGPMMQQMVSSVKMPEFLPLKVNRET